MALLALLVLAVGLGGAIAVAKARESKRPPTVRGTSRSASPAAPPVSRMTFPVRGPTVVTAARSDTLDVGRAVWPEAPAFVPKPYVAGPAIGPVSSPVAAVTLEPSYLTTRAEILGALSRGQAVFLHPNATPRTLWERSDKGAALALAGILSDAADDRRGADADRLRKGSVALDCVTGLLYSADELSPPDEVNARLTRTILDVASENREMVDELQGRVEDSYGAYALTPAFWAEVWYTAGAGVWNGLRAVQKPGAASHGGGPPIHLEMPWTPMDAEAYAHDVYAKYLK